MHNRRAREHAFLARPLKFREMWESLEISNW